LVAHVTAGCAAVKLYSIKYNISVWNTKTLSAKLPDHHRDSLSFACHGCVYIFNLDPVILYCRIRLLPATLFIGLILNFYFAQNAPHLKKEIMPTNCTSQEVVMSELFFACRVVNGLLYLSLKPKFKTLVWNQISVSNQN